MRHGSNPWRLAALLALVGLPLGCTYGFPDANQGHVYRCHRKSDCLTPEYVCGSDCRCDLASASTGVCTSDGGSPGGGGDGGIGDGGVTDGGTTDGGPGGCTQPVAVWPARFDTKVPTPATVFLASDFTPDTVVLEDSGQGVSLTLTPDGPGRYTVTLPKGESPVHHTLMVRAAGSSTTCASTSLDFVAEPAAGDTQVRATPQVVPNQVRTRLKITVNGLSLDPAATNAPVQVYAVNLQMQSPDQQVIPLEDAVVVASDEIDATMPPTSAVGSFDLVAVTQWGIARSSSAAALTTVDTAVVPKITSVSPLHVPLGADTSFSLKGDNLSGGDTASLWCKGSDGTWYQGTPASATVAGGSPADEVTLAPPTNVGPQAPCVLRYTGGGGLSAKYIGLATYAYDPSGTAAPPPPTWAPAGSGLNFGLQDAGAAVAHLSDGSRYLVVVGGLQGKGSAATVDHDDDVFPIGDDGVVGNAIQHSPGLTPGVIHPAVAAAGDMVYVVGGTKRDGTVSSDVREAEVLDPADRLPGLKATLLAGKGGPPANTYFYTVAAEFSAKATRPHTQGPAAYPVPVPVPAGSDAEVVLTWPQVNGATGYAVYRGTSPDPEQMVFFQGMNATAGASSYEFDDAGQGASGQGGTPPEPGDLSDWLPLHGLSNPRTGAGAAVVPGTTTGTQVLVVGLGSKDPVGQTGGTPYQGLLKAPLTPTSPGLNLGWFTAGDPSVARTGRAGVAARVIAPDWIGGTVALTEPWVLFGPGDPAGAEVDAWHLVSGSAQPTTQYVNGTAVPAGAAFCVGATSVVAVAGGASPKVLVAPLRILTGADGLGAPVLGSWTAPDTSGGQGDGLPVTHVTHMATAQDGPFCYLIGGFDPVMNAPAVSVQLTIR